MMERGSLRCDLVEADVGGDVFPPIGTEVAEEAHFAFAVLGFANGDKVDPAVVVVVERGDAEAASPVRLGQCDLLEGLRFVVAPERESGRSVMGEGEVHPVVMVKIEHCYGDGAGHGRAPWFACRKLALAWILKDYSRLARDYQVDSPVVVVVGPNRRRVLRTGGGTGQTRRACNIGKRTVAIVAPHHVGRSGHARGVAAVQVSDHLDCDIKIEISVMVIVNEIERIRHKASPWRCADYLRDLRSPCYVLKLAVLLVV